MTAKLIASLSLAAIIGLTPRTTWSQQQPATDFPPSADAGPALATARVAFAPGSVAPAAVWPGQPVVQQQTKDGTVAVIQSMLIFPGPGSFYAGNNSHGWRHLLIGVGTFGVMLASVSSCLNDVYGGGSCSSQGGGYVAGAVGYLANWVWGGFTASGDAKAYNQKSAPGQPKKRVVGNGE